LYDGKLKTVVESRVAESEVKCPTPIPNPIFQNFRHQLHNMNEVWLSTIW